MLEVFPDEGEVKRNVGHILTLMSYIACSLSQVSHMTAQVVPSTEVTYVSKPSDVFPQKLQPTWEKAPSISDLKADFSAAKPSHDEMVLNVERWRDHMHCLGEAAPRKVKGRSSVAPKLIRKHAEWRYPALSEPFLGQDTLFTCKGRTWEDTKAAQQSQILLNYQFETVIDKVEFIDDLVRAAVDDGTVAVELGWCQILKTRVDTVPVYAYYAVPEEEEEVIQQLQAVMALKEENPNEYKNLDPAIRASAEESQRQEMFVTALDTGATEEVEVQYYEANNPTAEICDLRNLFIDPSCNGKLDKAMFAIRSFETNYGEAKSKGIYKNLELVPWEQLSILSETDHKSTTPQGFQMEGKARNKVVAYRYHGYRDIHGTGDLVSIVATWIGDILIQLEETPFPDKKVPYVIGSLMPKRHSVYGEPDAELLIENQTTVGALTRGVVDLMARSANAQQGVPKGFLDIPNQRRFENGMDYQYNPMLGRPDQVLVQHTFPAIPNSALDMIALNVQDAGSLTGVQTNVNADNYGDAAAVGIKGVLAASSKRETSILRRLAKVVSRVGTKIGQMNMSFMSEEEIVRITNEKFVTVRKEDIQGRYDIRCEVSSAEADAAKSQKLAFMLQTIGPSVSFDITKKIMAEIARLDKMETLAHDLETYEPKPDPHQEMIQKLEIAEAEAKVAKLQAETAESQARAAHFAAQARVGNSTADTKDLAFVEQETGTTHARDMQKGQSQAEANQDLEVTKALLNPQAAGGPGLPEVNQAIIFNAISRNRS